MKAYNAVCCECQRLIPNGAVFSNQDSSFVMRYHPAISVNGDVRNWEMWFSQDHLYCRGSDTVPQSVDRNKSQVVNQTWF